VEYGELAVKASPEDFATHLILGRALLASEEPARAATELEQAAKLAPNSAQVHSNLADAYKHLGKRAEAVREQAESKRLEHPTGGKQIP
jgi:predicted Zn-dependent protease